MMDHKDLKLIPHNVYIVVMNPDPKIGEELLKSVSSKKM